MSAGGRAEDAGLQAWLVRLAAHDLRLDAVEDWQRRYEPIVDALRDKQMIADALAKSTAKALTDRFTKRHYLLGVLALFIPSIVTALVTAFLVAALNH